MELAADGLFRAKWTDRIHEEWTAGLLSSRPDLTVEQLQRTRDLMNRAVPDCLVEAAAYEPLVPALTLPDANDRHVLAAAVAAGADAIVTFNLKHFPDHVLDGYGIEPLHPDDFLLHQFGLNNPGVLIGAQRCRARLKHPIMSAQDYLDTLEKQTLPKTVAELRAYAGVI
jgi:hypothetical protein